MSAMIPAMCNAYSTPLIRVAGHTDERIRAIESYLRGLRAFDP
jgi:hypothetical protein